MIALACLAATAGRVYAEGEGPFLNTDIGASFITGLPSGVSVNPGVRFSLVPGYRIYNDDLFGVSLQFETGVIWNSFNNSSSGDLYQVPFLAGVEYAFHTGSIVEPYIGVAGGGVYSDFDFNSRFENNQSSVSGAVQGMAGVRDFRNPLLIGTFQTSEAGTPASRRLRERHASSRQHAGAPAGAPCARVGRQLRSA